MNAFSAPHLLVGAAAALLIACGAHYVTRGADLYAGGHYIEAAEVFERTEARLESSSPAERARYGLYRGATLLALGDAPRAERWLRYSQSVLVTETRALSTEERVMLQRALGVLARRRPAAPPGHDEPAVATQTSPPAETSPASDAPTVSEPAN